MIKSKRFNCVILGLLLAFAGSVLSETAMAGGDTAGELAGVQIRQKAKKFENDTGQDANDLHVAVYQKDPSAYVKGAAMSTAAFPTVNVGLSEGSFHNDGKNHQANGEFKDATVKDGEEIEIDIAIWLNEENQMWLKWDWTKDGVVIGGRGAAGIDIKLPRPGGNGGNPNAQQGNGGAGQFIHHITFFNDMDKAVQLDDFYALASMTYYNDLNDIDWTGVPVIIEDPITVDANSIWEYDFATTGAFWDGHIYLNYLVIDGEVQFHFDHPIVVPEPAMWMMLLACAAIFMARLRRSYKE